MDAQIALILLTDGIANGAIYLLIALGIVLIFSVTRVIFVPFGDIAALTVLTVAALQLGRLPGTVWLVAMLAAIAVTMELALLLRRGQPQRIPAAIANYALLPMLPVAAAAIVASAGARLPQLAEIYRALRDLGQQAPAADLESALRGTARYPRDTIVCARLLAVLTELGVIELDLEGPSCRILEAVTSDLELSPTCRAARAQLRAIEQALAPELPSALPAAATG